jgi:hypothetical protein
MKKDKAGTSMAIQTLKKSSSYKFNLKVKKKYPSTKKGSEGESGKPIYLDKDHPMAK